MKRKNKLKVMQELQKRLNGKCSGSLETCPKHIANSKIKSEVWYCSDCVNIFKGIVDLNNKLRRDLVSPELLIQYNPCPCKYVPDIALSRLNEYIEELKEEIKNEKKN